MTVKVKYVSLFIAAFLSLFIKGMGQQSSLFTQYMFNGLAINPAYAGSHESLSLTALFRKQWVGVEGSPCTQTFSAHTPLNNEKIALGLQLLNDRIGITHQYAIHGIYAYRINLNEKGKLSFGLQTSLNRYVAGYTSLSTRDPNDPSFSSDERSPFIVNFGTGVYYSTAKFYAGISVPYLLTQGIFNEGPVTESAQRRHYFLTAGYLLELSPDLKLKPSILLKTTQDLPGQLDLNCNLLIKDVLWLGASYRSFSSLNFITQVQLTNQMSLGYSYDSSVNRISQVSNGSHEFVLTYNFKFMGSNVVSPRYF